MSGVAGVDDRSLGLRVVAARRRVEGWGRDGSDAIRRATARPRGVLAPLTSVVSVPAWATLVLAVVAACGAIALGWPELRFAAFFLAFILLISIAFVVGGRKLTARLDLTRDRVVVGERANGRLLVTNGSARRTLPMTVELPVGAGRADFDLPSLHAEAEHEDLFAIPTAKRAVLTVGPVRAVRTDPLHLLRREHHLTDEQLLYVHPKTVRIGGSAAGFIRDLEGQTVKKLSDSDVAFHALRNYVPGDDRRYIHWKTSARTGTLMVRQFEETRRSHLLVALSTRLEEYANDEEFELAVSVAGSLGVQGLADDQPVSAATSTSQLRSTHPKVLLDQLSGVDYDVQAPRLSEVVRRLARDVQGASVAVIVCGSVVEAAELRRARRHLPFELRAVVVRSEMAADATIRRMGDVDIATVGELDDLPGSMRRMAT